MHPHPIRYLYVDLEDGAGGNILILSGCGPMGLGAISYGLAFEKKPKRIVVTDINAAKIARAKEVISEAENMLFEYFGGEQA